MDLFRRGKEVCDGSNSLTGHVGRTKPELPDVAVDELVQVAQVADEPYRQPLQLAHIHVCLTVPLPSQPSETLGYVDYLDYTGFTDHHNCQALEEQPHRCPESWAAVGLTRR